MLLLIVVQNVVGCTALNLSLPEFPLLAGFNFLIPTVSVAWKQMTNRISGKMINKL